MDILLNTEKNIGRNEEMRKPLKASIADAFDKCSQHLTRIEVKISDENGDKDSDLDKRCVLEVRLKRIQPIAGTSHGNTIKTAVDEAIK